MSDPDPSKPLLFVAMPFGTRNEPGGTRTIDFDALYETCIAPAAEQAGVEVIRADEETLGGIIHKPMYERLLLAEVVVADLTFANPNVFYELGVRHAARPRSTILIYAKLGALPFDVAPIRAIAYDITDADALADPDGLRATLADRLERAKTDDAADSPLFQLLADYPGVRLAHESTEAFRARALWVSQLTVRAHEAVRRGDERDEALAELADIEHQIRSLPEPEEQLLVTLLLSYRAVEAWEEMIRVAEGMPGALAGVVTIREQLAMALNRRAGPGDRNRAIELLSAVIDEHGASPETLGLLGRCFKDRWREKQDAGDAGAGDALDDAIDAYARGFEVDPRDFYPGINLVTLLLRRGTDDDLARIDEVAPVVSFATARMGALRSGEYWTIATVLELAVISADERLARRAQSALHDTEPHDWMLRTTADNLRILDATLTERGRGADWISEIVDDLTG